LALEAVLDFAAAGCVLALLIALALLAALGLGDWLILLAALFPYLAVLNAMLNGDPG
jgi:hypothetical protein